MSHSRGDAPLEEDDYVPAAKPPECYRCTQSLHRRFGWAASVLLSLIIIGTHILFYFGQFDPLYSFKVTLDVRNVNVSVDFRALVNTKHISIPIDDVNLEDVIDVFSFNDTLHRLWDLEDNSNRDLHAFGLWGDANWEYNHQTPYVLFWVLLFMSGIWPHCKLIAVHLLWYLPANPKLRTTWLWWLDFFGKYSMADVFLCLVLVSYTRMTVDADVVDIMGNIQKNLPYFMSQSTNTSEISYHLCDKLLHFNATNTLRCELISDLVQNFGDEWVLRTLLGRTSFNTTHGHVHLGFSAATNPGIYWFSTAVWCTLLVSAVVNVLSERVQKELNDDSSASDGAGYVTLNEQTTANEERTQLLYSTGMSFAERFMTMLLLTGTALATALGMVLPLLDRYVYGTVISILDMTLDLDGEGFHEEFSMIQTMDAVAEGGGQNRFLQKDLVAFTLVCPCLLILLSAALLLVPMHRRAQSFTLEACKLMFSFTGWEIFVIVCLLMINQLQALTVTLPLALPDFVMGVCKPLETIIVGAPEGGICFEQVLKVNAKGFVPLVLGMLGMIILRVLIGHIHHLQANMPPKYV